MALGMARLALFAAAAWCFTGLHAAIAAHAAVGTPVPKAEMPTLDGGKAAALSATDASVLVFFRPNQERSLATLRDLAKCQAAFAGKPVRWVGVVSGSAPADTVSTLVRDAHFTAPVLLDEGDALYGSLGIAVHPVVVVIGRDHKLAAFEAFRSIDYCTVITARIRHLLGEINDAELQAILEPPKAVEGGDVQVARRWKALAEAQFKAGNLDKALDSAKKSIDKDPQFAAAHALTGDILQGQGNCPGAAEAYKQALAIDANDAVAKAGLVRCPAAH
jgi:tetratricopeptide (TPR) repeat protein